MNPSALPISADESAYGRYVEALLAGDRQRCREEFEAWLAAGTDLRTVYQRLIQRSLYEVGLEWERGRTSVATEHLATAISESLLNLTYPLLFGHPRLGRTAVVTCTANEYHQIGGQMVADLFELHGWRGYFLGANTPVGDLLELIRQKQPEVVALSLTVQQGLDALLHAAEQIRAQFPAVPILVGGQAFRGGGRERVEQMVGVLYLPSLDELELWIESHSLHAT